MSDDLPPTLADYRAAFKAGRGPGPKLIEDRMGGIRSLNELLGFPHIQSWEEEDFINWGVRVMTANGGMRLTTLTTNLLQQRRRGPSARTVIEHFDRWSTYEQAVYDAYTCQQDLRERRLVQYRQLAAQAALPESASTLADDALLAMGAQYRIAQRLLPDARADSLRNLARQDLRTFTRSLHQRQGWITAGHIETEAILIGVADDLWPPTELLSELFIDPAVLDEARQMQSERKRLQRRNRQQAMSVGAVPVRESVRD